MEEKSSHFLKSEIVGQISIRQIAFTALNVVSKKGEAFKSLIYFSPPAYLVFIFAFELSVPKSYRLPFRSPEFTVQKRSYSTVPPPLMIATGGVTVGITRVAAAQVVLMASIALVGGLRVAGSVRYPHAES